MTRPPPIGHDCDPDRDGFPTCGGIFICAACGMPVGWCRGCHDDQPERCDDCWVAGHGRTMEATT